MNRAYSFGKKDRLKSRKLIEELFKKGRSLSFPPVRILYLFQSSEAEGNLQAGVTVSKRNFKKSVDRNRIKRLLKEAYRLQKNELLELSIQYKRNVYLFISYTDKSIPNFPVIKEAIAIGLKKLNHLLVNESIS